MNNDLKYILNHLNKMRGFDFSGYRTHMIERRVKQRFLSTKSNNYNDYLQYLKGYPEELDNLLDVLTINVSRFFRDTLMFEYIADRILPAIVRQKEDTTDHSLRIWSAGCAMGEEPYSIAILIQDLFKKEAKNFQVNIFATDIGEKILKKAKKAVYPLKSIEGVKYRLLNEYFAAEEKLFKVIPEIKDLVSFSVYDILDTQTSTPPESIYGDFDLVFCRNVLIYFDPEHQDQIFGKLYHALAGSGYLVLGETETPSRKYQRYFQRVNECCHIYRKI